MNLNKKFFSLLGASLMMMITILSGCTMLNEYTIEDTTWHLSTVVGFTSNLWDDDYYRFKNGRGILTHKKSATTGAFNYTMSSNIIKLSTSDSSSSGLTDGSYKVYYKDGDMIWYDSNFVECYRFSAE